MKKLFVMAALAALAMPALAGGDGCASKAKCAGDVASKAQCSTMVAYRCENACPLAKTANSLRSYGTEALRSSKIARADLSKSVVSNLARI